MNIRTIALSALLLLAACGGYPDTAKGITEAYVDAAMDGDLAGMRAALSPLAVEAYDRPTSRSTFEEALPKTAERFSKVADYEVVSVEALSGYSKVRVKFTFEDGKESTRTWPVRTVDGQWRLDELRGP